MIRWLGRSADFFFYVPQEIIMLQKLASFAGIKGPVVTIIMDA